MKAILIVLSVAFLALALRFGYGLGVDDSIRFFDVGQGDASLVSCGRAQFLIDGGPDRIVLNRLGAVMPFFDRRIEYVLLSHPHDDHVFGLFATLGRYEVGRVLVSEYAAEEWRGSEFIRFAEEHGIEVVAVGAGDTVELCPEMRLDIVWPDRAANDTVGKGESRTNDLSVVGKLVLSTISDENRQPVSERNRLPVFRLNCGQNTLVALFPGDITTIAERAILDSGADISACILKVPHHGSRYSSSPDFVRAVDPSLSVIQVGENRYGQPSQTTIRRLEAVGSIMLRTDANGSISLNP